MITKNSFIAIIVILIFAGIGAWVFLGAEKSGESSISQPGNQLSANNISNSEGNKAKEQMKSLTSILQDELLKMGPSDTSLIATAVKKYETGFNTYIATINQLSIVEIDQDSLKSIRLAEWENYKLYLAVKQRFATNTMASQVIVKTQKILDDYIKSQSIKSMDPIIVKTSKKSSTLFPDFPSRIGEMIINTAKAEQTTGGVVHIKAILDPDDPGQSGKLLACSGYESWVDLRTGDVRQEARGGLDKCQIEINITEGATGRKIGLNQTYRLAEWIMPPKIGIGDEVKKNPYADFKEKLDQGMYVLSGTDIFNGKEVYLLKTFFISSARPEDRLNYQVTYLDAVSYLPIRKLSYGEDVAVEPIPGDPTKSNIIRTGKAVNNFGTRYIAGEIIKRESLPSDFFELKIPDGYELRDWVANG